MNGAQAREEDIVACDFGAECSDPVFTFVAFLVNVALFPSGGGVALSRTKRRKLARHTESASAYRHWDDPRCLNRRKAGQDGISR